MSPRSVVGQERRRERLAPVYCESASCLSDSHRARAEMMRQLGFLGFGNIGTQIASMARSLGFRDIIYHSRHANPAREERHVSLAELYAESDAIVITCPLTSETRGMLSDSAFERMKDGVVLVNVARGPIIDDEALVRALRSGKGKPPLLLPSGRTSAAAN